MDKISVIIPVYNVESYLSQCIHSVVNQSYADLEIILINDGSTDRSGEICDEWGKKDSRIRVIHKENGGLSDARNTGLDIAQGKYIGFVDSDDFIHPKMYEYLLCALEDNKADMASCSYTSYIDGEMVEDTVLNQNGYTFVKVENREQYLNNFTDYNFMHYVWRSLYKRNFLDNIRFQKGKRLEDVMFCAEMSRYLSKRAVIADKLYYYRMRQNSIMHSNPSIFLEHIEAMEHNIEFFSRQEGKDFSQKYNEYVMSYILTTRMERKLNGISSEYVNIESMKAFAKLYDKYGSRNKSHWLARHVPMVYNLLKEQNVRKYLKVN